MAKDHRIFHQNKVGWFIELPDHVEGPMDSREEAQKFVHLLNIVGMARSAEVACTDKECC